MKLIKALSLLLSVLLLATSFVACKKNDKDKTQSGDKNESQGYDEIIFDDEEDDESGDIVIDFDTGSVISKPSDDSSNVDGSGDSSQSNPSKDEEPSNEKDDDKDSDKDADKDSDKDSDKDVADSNKDQGEMEGYAPWQDSTIN